MKEILYTLVLCILLYFLIKKLSKAQTTKKESQEPPKSKEFNPAISYKQKWMFTLNEKPIYEIIEKISNEQNKKVFAKVRVFDLIEPRESNNKTALWKIQAKHVDFVITTDNLVATHIIELDDNSHNTSERQERDKFVDEALTSCGYKVLHIRGPQEEIIRTFLYT